MKATLTFNLEEERVEFEQALKGTEYYCAAFEFYQNSIRKRLKYESDNLTDEQVKLLEEIKEEFVLAFEGLNV